ncbi:MAG: hypothetical protein JNM07_01960 [Phycisphaerae bacterium]|nr:hypothetical protein [Phycisphaerae bacterium]
MSDFAPTPTQDFPSSGDNLDPRIPFVLDGALKNEELARFEADAKASPVLRAQLDTQHDIDRAIRSMFRPPEGITLTTHLPYTLHPAATSRRPMWRLAIYAAAAMVLLVSAVAVRQSVLGPEFKVLTPSQLFNRLESSGFKPEFVCTTDDAFAHTIRERFGQALLVPAAKQVASGGSIELTGWAYADGYNGSPISPRTLILLAREHGQDVVVLIDRHDADRTVAPPEDGTLSVHRRRIGDLVVYELRRRIVSAESGAEGTVAAALFDPDSR